nr:MAG TPA: hypothetical protein [Caudoviricetes sp.]
MQLVFVYYFLVPLCVYNVWWFFLYAFICLLRAFLISNDTLC